MSSPDMRNRPAGQPDGLGKASSTLTILPADADIRAVKQHSTNPSDITLAILRRSAAAFGLSLSVRCSRCGAVLSSTRSLSASLGPVCRKRAAS